MHLIGLKQEDGWILSHWQLTYPVGWLHIQKGVAHAFDFYDDAEVLVRREPVSVGKAEEVMDLPEERDMTVRGVSKILKVPVMITFFNQVSDVEVLVPQVNEEFRDTDYEKFNHSMCQYLDSIEIAMFD